MDLHYSQTTSKPHVLYAVFESPMDLHYSQTQSTNCCKLESLNPLWIYTTLKQYSIYYSQYIGLNPLWIYTTLKPMTFYRQNVVVWIPYGFTLLSNDLFNDWGQLAVWIPYGFTLLSNIPLTREIWLHVWIPYGFTLLSNRRWQIRLIGRVWIPYGFTLLSNLLQPEAYPVSFESPMDLHYSQTNVSSDCCIFGFESPMDLHYSQTIDEASVVFNCLNPLWIYTTLKRNAPSRYALLVWIPYGFTLLSNVKFA